MLSTRIGPRRAAAAVALLLAAVLPSGFGRAAEDAALRKQVLALNETTGDDAIQGEILTLAADPARARKLLPVATKMAKEKDPPLNYNAAYILARTAQRLKDIDDGVALYRLAIDQATKLKSGTQMGQAYSGLINLYYDNGKFAESEKLCREFLGIPAVDEFGRPNEAIRRMKGVVLEYTIQAIAKQGKIDEAKKEIDKLLKAQKDNWLLLELRGWVEREAGEYAAAAKTYEDVLERIGKDSGLEKEEKTAFSSEVRYILSSVYIDADKVEKAAEQLQALLKDDPGNPTYNNDLGYIWADHDMHLDEAEKLIRKAIEQDKKQQREANPSLKPEEVKGNAAYLDSLGWVLFKKKKYKEARPYLEEAVKGEDGQHIEILDHLGDVNLALGEKAAAVAAWKKGLEVAAKAPKPSKREQERKAEVEKKLKANE
jgi:tetratricopeptide (TPR) repeat protein